MAIAQNAARQAWRGGARSVDDETRLLDLFGRTFTSTDHDMRMDALLWADAPSAADQQLAYTSPGRRAVFEARLALKRTSPDAALNMQADEATGASDEGFIADQWMLMRATGNSWVGRDRRARRPVLVLPTGETGTVA